MMQSNTPGGFPDKVEGQVIIKRKAFWVKRYAKIENSIFTYKKDKSKYLLINLVIDERQARAVVDLRKATVKYS